MIRSFLLLIVLIGSTTSVAETLVIGVGDQNQKAVSVKNGKLIGSVASNYQCILDKLGFAFDLQLLPQARILRQLEQGEIAIGMPLVKYNDWDEFAIYTNTVIRVPYYLFSSKELDLSQDLSNRTFGIMRASITKDMAIQRNAQYREVTSWLQALSMVKLGRVDGAIIPGPIVEHLGKESFSGLTQAYLESKPVSFYVSKKAKNAENLVKRLNDTIDMCIH